MSALVHIDARRKDLWPLFGGAETVRRDDFERQVRRAVGRDKVHIVPRRGGPRHPFRVTSHGVPSSAEEIDRWSAEDEFRELTRYVENEETGLGERAVTRDDWPPAPGGRPNRA